jgi:hypothetical protein
MCQQSTGVLHSARCVHETALLLSYLACRAMIDGERSSGAEAMAGKIPALIRQEEIGGLDAAEIRFINSPFGSLTVAERCEASWLIEGMAVLAWALEKAELPSFWQRVDAAHISDKLGMFRPGVKDGLARAALRDSEEIGTAALSYAALHWRLAKHNENPGKVDFEEHLKHPDTGVALAHDFELLEGDIVIDGAPLERITRQRFLEIWCIVRERIKAFRWLLGFDHGYGTLTMVQ